ncbi:right-handed parallel beta-helix repeat-containing protein [Candidatus Bipolaricaulota bacterium]|nr:right-handed parallel beta-helix repeat-containing protein [Candidatus Bipolaricaulota bacterium]
MVLAVGLISAARTYESVRIVGEKSLEEAEVVDGGSGTENDPYVIKDWQIDASGSDYGLLLKGTDAYILISELVVSGARNANLSLREVENVTVKGCKLKNSDNGVEVINGKHVELDHNRVTSNKFGISIVKGSRSTIKHNLIRSNKFGIYLESVELNEISYNQVEKNSWNGVYVDSTSRTNTFHYNNFIDNQVAPIRAANRLNNWNGEEAGNYWSDYTGEDQDGDGIGDTAFKIPSSQTKVYDYKPLVEPCSDTYNQVD